MAILRQYNCGRKNRFLLLTGKCKMVGNGLTEVHPTDHLDASLVGKGTIRYKGPATVEQRSIGKGSIEEIK